MKNMVLLFVLGSFFPIYCAAKHKSIFDEAHYLAELRQKADNGNKQALHALAKMGKQFAEHANFRLSAVSKKADLRFPQGESINPHFPMHILFSLNPYKTPSFIQRNYSIPPLSDEQYWVSLALVILYNLGARTFVITDSTVTAGKRPHAWYINTPPFDPEQIKSRQPPYDDYQFKPLSPQQLAEHFERAQQLQKHLENHGMQILVAGIFNDEFVYSKRTIGSNQAVVMICTIAKPQLPFKALLPAKTPLLSSKLLRTRCAIHYNENIL
jgi:hypothetical protein